MLVEHNGQPYTPMRLLVEGMALDWKSRHRKLRGQDDHAGSSRFSSCVTELVMQLPGDVQRRAVTCIALRKLPGWPMSIEPGKVKDAAVAI